MTCNEIDHQLPAYLENLLPPEKRKSIEGHLASCPRCSRAFADLKKAEALVQGLGEVEPPPFFEQRIMSRVREEAGRKQGILRRLFHPLHVKVPVQALATLLVAVLAFYVYQQGEPEMKRMAPLPIPLAEPGKGRTTAESPKTLAASPAAAPIKRPPAGNHSEKERQRLVAPPFENGGKADGAADSRASIREERPAAMKPAAPVMTAKEKDAPPVKMEALSPKQDRTGKQGEDKALETPLLPEQKRKERMADAGAAAGESRKMMSAPAPSGLTAAAAAKQSAIDLTIQVRDTAAAIREIEARLSQFNARIIERLHREDSEFLKVEIAAGNVAAFLDRLERIGGVHLEKSPPAVPDGNVTIGIKIVSRP